MFCSKCGAQVPDGAAFCPVCGEVLNAPKEAPVETPVAQETVSVDEAAKTSAAKSVMIIGIVAIALSELGLPGIILAAIANKKVAAYEAQYGPCTGMAKVGRILAKVALPVSIVMTVVWVIYTIVIAAYAGLASSIGRYY